MIFEFELNGVSVSKNIPIRWEEVTFRQFLEITDNREITALSVFTGIPIKELQVAQIYNLNELIKLISFVKKPAEYFKYPETILGYPVKQDLSFVSFGQYQDIKTEVEKPMDGMERLKRFPYLCAVYTTNPYDSEVAESRVEEFFNAPCTEVLALGNFLIVKLIALNNTISKTSQKPLTRLKKLKLALIAWRAHLAFRVRFFIFNRFHRITPKRN